MGIRSMFSGVSGLQAHSTWLDVIGNNISNVNTVAYKASRVEFADQISQRLGYASSPDAASGLGGVNGSQVGLGSRVESIQTIFTQGVVQSTGLNTDVMISGDGFLISQVNGQNLYTRAGNLSVDGQGNLVDANGGLIQGWRSVSQFTQRTILDGAGDVLHITDNSLKLDSTSAPSSIQITKGMTCPARATTEMNFTGNMDAGLKNTDATNGGMLDLGSATILVYGATPVAGTDYAKIPMAAATLNATKAQWVVNAGGGNELQQLQDFTQPDPAAVNQNVASSVVTTGGLDIATARGDSFIWDDANAYSLNPPAFTTNQTVYDSNGMARNITILGYQVNDLGDAGHNSVNGPSQAAYAWYAFDTTGGAKVASSNLVGGTGITLGYNEGSGTMGCGDVLFFNTDGSLASTGQTGNGGDTQEAAHLYITPLVIPTGAGVSPIPTQGAEIMDIRLNFGTAGILGKGGRDGVYGDAAGTYQLINGVNTYIPNQSVSVASQDGYAEGVLQDYSFDTTGKILGTFSNDQTIVLGQVAMARVQNQEGLTKVGSNYYTVSANSGSVYIGTANSNGIGALVGGALEGSNVDLTTELTNMIIAQRGFEANSNSIRVANETLQTVVQLGR